MKQTSATISFIVICLIFLYWYKKRAKTHSVECVNLWENIKNSSARTIFFNALSLTENDADLKANLIEQSAEKGWKIEYTNCKYALKYLSTHGMAADMINTDSLVTEGESQKIDKCVCGKYLTS